SRFAWRTPTRARVRRARSAHGASGGPAPASELDPERRAERPPDVAGRQGPGASSPTGGGAPRAGRRAPGRTRDPPPAGGRAGLATGGAPRGGCVTAAPPFTEPASRPAGGRRPNVLLLMADQLRWDAVGAYWPEGRSPVRTPNLDRIAREGARFERCYTASPICMPARAS